VKPAVVYIDDEPAICRIVRWRLEAAGLAVETFTDPEAAIAWMGTHDVRCVLCDYRMPAMSGFEVLARIGERIPFYLVTGDLSLGNELAGHARVRGIIHKPFSFDSLVALLRGLEG
jgi:DNA-binding response OmpR family regulator